MVGGHYTYGRMPLFEWLKDAAGWSRNHYDRAGHFMQGAGPAIVAREILLRTTPLSGTCSTVWWARSAPSRWRAGIMTGR